MAPIERVEEILKELGVTPPELSLEQQAEFLAIVDDSPFPIEDWARAWGALIRHLESRNSTLEIPMQTHYLTCAAEGAAPGGRPYTTLESAVEEYLETEGVALAQKKTAP